MWLCVGDAFCIPLRLLIFLVLKLQLGTGLFGSSGQRLGRLVAVFADKRRKLVCLR